MNKQQDERRREILGLDITTIEQDITHVDFTVEQLDLLIKEGFLDPESSQNDSPTAQEFCEFIREHPDFVAHGYLISAEREDCRITLEGIKSTGDSIPKDRGEFVKLCRRAHEFRVESGRLYAWWD